MLRVQCSVCKILAENVLNENLNVKLDIINLIVGTNTRQVSRVGVNKIKEMNQEMISMKKNLFSLESNKNDQVEDFQKKILKLFF